MTPDDFDEAAANLAAGFYLNAEILRQFVAEALRLRYENVRLREASKPALEWIDRAYPPLIFTGESKDWGAVEIAKIRERLRAAVTEGE